MVKKVSIIIVTYNSEKDIFDCVRSIQEYADIPFSEIELIVVDNNSLEPDKMFMELRNLWGDDIVLIKNSRNGGYGQGNNVGIRRASAPVILIMNPDVRLASPFFAKPLEAFAKDERLIMYGMKQWYTPSLPSQSSFSCTYRMNGYLRTVLEGCCNRFNLFIPSLMHLSGSCFYVRKAAFEAIGLFDETVFMYGEEDDIRWRFEQKFGNHICFDKSLRYLHLTAERPPCATTELKYLEVAILQNEKKGYAKAKTINNFIQIYKLKYWRECLRRFLGKPHRELEMLQELLPLLREKKKQLMNPNQ